MTEFDRRYRRVSSDSNIEAPFGLPDADISTAGLNVWARSAPKEAVFNRYLTLADQLGLELNVYVDDLCAQAVSARTDDLQKEINEKYIRYFEHGANDIVFSSAVLPSFDLAQFTNVAQQVYVQEFERNILPEKKRTLPNAKLSEIGHAVVQLAFLGEIAKRESLLLCGQFSLGVMYTARDMYDDFPKVITMPKEVDL